MPKTCKRLLLMACALTICGCAATGKAVSPPQVCPQPQPVPPELMVPPNYEQRLRDELLQPEPSATQPSARSNK